ncbi:MAG: hypothetical protein H7834_12075 [Magnetococcus sp. YQC-9]
MEDDGASFSQRQEPWGRIGAYQVFIGITTWRIDTRTFPKIQAELGATLDETWEFDGQKVKWDLLGRLFAG